MFIKEENNVLVLTADNFKDAITDNKYILVMFYAPWSNDCKLLAPEYAAAAGKLSEEQSEIKLGKVDATVWQTLAEENGAHSFPTIKFFKYGKSMDYGAGLVSKRIVTWLKKMTEPPVQDLMTVEAAKKFQEDRDVCVIGFFANQSSAAAKVFKDVASDMDDVDFGITEHTNVLAHYKMSDDGIVLFKKFDKLRNDFEGPIEKEPIKTFINGNMFSLVIEYSEEKTPMIFGGDIRQHVFYLTKDKHADHLKDFAVAAQEFKGKLYFIHFDVTAAEGEGRLMQLLGVKDSDLPTIRFIDLKGEMVKYKPETDNFDSAAVKTFVQDVIDGKVKAC